MAKIVLLQARVWQTLIVLGAVPISTSYFHSMVAGMLY
jgi:hypothetical protein